IRAWPISRSSPRRRGPSLSASEFWPGSPPSRGRTEFGATPRTTRRSALIRRCAAARWDWTGAARGATVAPANDSSNRGPMTLNSLLWERQLPRNTGFTFDLTAGQAVRITSQSIIDFVCFNRENLRERFDQARTKANQRKVFISTGDLLVSKLNNTM